MEYRRRRCQLRIFRCPTTILNTCFTTFTFNYNAVLATPSRYAPSSFPSNNMFPQSPTNVGFAAFNNGNGGNYELEPTVLTRMRGATAKIWADIVGLNAALAGVE